MRSHTVYLVKPVHNGLTYTTDYIVNVYLFLGSVLDDELANQLNGIMLYLSVYRRRVPPVTFGH